MLRWFVGTLVIANLLAFAALRGMFGAYPAAGFLEPAHLKGQVHPEWMTTHAENPAAPPDEPVVAGPAPTPEVQASAVQ